MALVANDLANAIVDQLDEAWQIVKGEPFPGGSRSQNEDKDQKTHKKLCNHS